MTNPDASLYLEIRRMTRDLLVGEVPMVHRAFNDDREPVPIEACYLLVVNREGEGAARASSGFVPAELYPKTRRCCVGEIGTIERARVVVDEHHEGPPRLYGGSEYLAKVAP